jgi:hypothetical protein
VKVQAFTSDTTERSDLHLMNEISSLDELFATVEDSLQVPVTNLCARAKVYDESAELVASVCTMFHLSRLLMHASMVPMLSGRPNQSLCSPQTSLDHIKMVLQDAGEFVKILQQFEEHDLDLTRLWPMTGYGSFIVVNVLLVRALKARDDFIELCRLMF